MSREMIVAKRYAKALFEVAQQQGNVAQVEEELKGILQVIRENADYGKLLEHPNISAADKLGLVKQAFEGKVSTAVLNTLQLIVERRRESVLADLVDSYVKVANEALGQANATVVSAYPLTAEESQQVAEKFGQVTGKRIRVTNVVDASLIGGIQVRIGDRLYDGSMSGKLKRLEQALS
ncbi:F0F1 ATP synthase subunit delta [Paenibacillus sp. HJGM_3]|uniref:F0F1 ATP synthase subunit delta n=1 Tax=Paenibacillus sp. HJGM_3 TaxID=3379816 RepID=UPI00385AC3D0